jgi:predicted dithiol-disulfide oxidoreductase (DUF899 family)
MLTMAFKNIKTDSINNGVSAHFLLENRKTLTLDISWNNNDGEKWSFDVLINALGRNDFDYQTSHFDKNSLKDALNYLETKATPEETRTITLFILEQKELIKPKASSYENYYGI